MTTTELATEPSDDGQKATPNQPKQTKADKKPSTTALIIDDEPANRDFLLRLIEQVKYTTVGAGSGKEARQLLAGMKQAPRLIVVDRELPDCEGIELLKQFRKDYPESLLVMATMHDDLAVIREAFECGCNVFLVKPHGFMELFKRLSRLDDDPEALNNLVIDRMGVRAFRR